MKRLPSHIAWPVAIVALLAANISIAVGTYIAANAGDGVQVERDYYARAVAWDSLSTIDIASKDLGWITTVSVVREEKNVQVTFKDKQSRPIGGLVATVTASRPQSSIPIGTFVLTEVHEGTYDSIVPLGTPGLYDIAITANDGVRTYVKLVRIDVE